MRLFLLSRLHCLQLAQCRAGSHRLDNLIHTIQDPSPTNLLPQYLITKFNTSKSLKTRIMPIDITIVIINSFHRIKTTIIKMIIIVASHLTLTYSIVKANMIVRCDLTVLVKAPCRIRTIRISISSSRRLMNSTRSMRRACIHPHPR